MQCFILAGGFATRLWPLTERRAKPLLPLAGKPILTHLIEKIPPDMPVTVSINAAVRGGFEEWMKDLGRPNVSIVVEETRHDDEKLGALGATAQWIETRGIAEDVMLLTGDNYCGFALGDLIDARRPGTPIIAAHDIGNRRSAAQFGTVILAENGTSVAAFEEKPPEPKTSLVSTGFSVLPAALLPIVVEFAVQKPDNVGGIFEEFLRRNIGVDCYVFDDAWFDIGSFESYLQATARLVGERVAADPSAQMSGNEYEGSVVVGGGTVIRDSRLRNVVVFGNCSIVDCVLEDCVIDDGCSLRGVDLSGKMLRAGTALQRTP